jgi:hypothetical protein
MKIMVKVITSEAVDVTFDLETVGMRYELVVP